MIAVYHKTAARQEKNAAYGRFFPSCGPRGRAVNPKNPAPATIFADARAFFKNRAAGFYEDTPDRASRRMSSASGKTLLRSTGISLYNASPRVFEVRV